MKWTKAANNDKEILKTIYSLLEKIASASVKVRMAVREDLSEQNPDKALLYSDISDIMKTVEKMQIKIEEVIQ